VFEHGSARPTSARKRESSAAERPPQSSPTCTAAGVIYA